jgi:PAS domain S-box-containing protein
VVHARRERQAEVQRWRDLFRQAPAAVALLRGPGHTFEFVNDAYEHLIGGRQVVGKTVAEALPEIQSQGFTELLDKVYRSGEAHLGLSIPTRLQREPGAPVEERVVDFIYQPVRHPAGDVDGIFVLVTDVTQRARAENALRVSNWQLGEERARLAALIEAEQRAQQALRRFNETLEAHVKARTAELTRALETQSALTDRLRATFATDLIFQGFMDVDGNLLDANPVSLAAIRCTLADVVGRPFWDTAWFNETPGAPAAVRQAVQHARQGHTVSQQMTVNLPDGPRRYLFSVRPAFNAKREVVGLVPEAVELPDIALQKAA